MLATDPGVGIVQWILAAVVPTPTSAPDDVWGWISGTLSVSDIIQGSGLALIVILFATRRILTIADHRSRIEDQAKYHAAILKEKDDRYAEMRESRDAWKETAAEERTGREKAEEGVRELGIELGGLTTHLLGSLDDAAEKS